MLYVFIRRRIIDIFLKTYRQHLFLMFKDEVCANFAHTTEHGAVKGKTQTRELDYYNLDMIISIGYRVNGKLGVMNFLNNE